MNTAQIKMSAKVFAIIVLTLHVTSSHGLTNYNIERYMSPILDMSHDKNTIASHSIDHDTVCVLLCMATPNCVAVNIGPEADDGNIVCELKDHLVVQERWLTPNPGYSYFHVGKC